MHVENQIAYFCLTRRPASHAALSQISSNESYWLVRYSMDGKIKESHKRRTREDQEIRGLKCATDRDFDCRLQRTIYWSHLSAICIHKLAWFDHASIHPSIYLSIHSQEPTTYNHSADVHLISASYHDPLEAGVAKALF